MGSAGECVDRSIAGGKGDRRAGAFGGDATAWDDSKGLLSLPK